MLKIQFEAEIIQIPLSYLNKMHNCYVNINCICFLSVFLHACRALAVCAVITGFFGGVLTLIGMKCTKIGGTEIVNSRVTFSGAITYLASGKQSFNDWLISFQNSQKEVLKYSLFSGRGLRHDHLLVVG